MGLELPCFVAGARVAPRSDAPTTRALVGDAPVHVAETSQAELRRALRHAEACQRTLASTPLAERVAAARRVVDRYVARTDEVCAALAALRGIVSRDTRWMCEVILRWSEQLDQLVSIMMGSASPRPVHDGATRCGELVWRSKGTACVFSSATMDGPPAVVALCHAMVSGTHLILKPSYRDGATHLAFEAMYEEGLGRYAQLVRWQSDSRDAGLLNRMALRHATQTLVFSAADTYRALIDDAAEPASDDRDAIQARTRRYGTGLPLAIVTANADLDRAAHDLIEGARLGGGRFCLSAGPVLVERACQQGLLERLRSHALDLRRGSPLEPTTDLCTIDRETAESLRRALPSLGGAHAFGEIRDSDMDVVLLRDVPGASACLDRELPGPVLSLVPFDELSQACSIASAALRRNHREAWTAVLTFASDLEHETVMQEVPAFRYLRSGVVSRVKLLLPHQGSYFGWDLMRPVSLE